MGATAEYAASFGIMIPYYKSSPEYDARVIERYVRLLKKRAPAFEPTMLSDTRPEASIQSPSRIMPQWLATVQDRIYRSIVPRGREFENDGRWLRHGVAEMASGFFQAAADLLPGEPHIYGSQMGDLVAEFEAAHGTMTGIVTPTSVILYAVVDGTPSEMTLTLETNAATLRRGVQRLIERSHPGQHGLEAAN